MSKQAILMGLLLILASFAQAQEVAISGPETVEQGGWAKVSVTGIKATDLLDNSVLEVLPEGATILDGATWGGDPYILLFPPKKSPAKAYTIILIVWDKKAYLKHTVEVEGPVVPQVNPYPQPLEQWSQLRTILQGLRMEQLDAVAVAQVFATVAQDVADGSLSEEQDVLDEIAEQMTPLGLRGKYPDWKGRLNEAYSFLFGTAADEVDQEKAKTALLAMAYLHWEAGKP